MDAGDWIRLKRLHGALSLTPSTPNPGTVNPPVQQEVKSARRVYTEFGTSKIRSPASFYTDYKASQKADYILESFDGSYESSKSLTIHKLCTCRTSSAIKHNGVCIKCTHDRIVNRNTTN